MPEEDKKFLGKPLRLFGATEPSNIIWENRHTTLKDIAIRSCITIVVVIILLTGALALFSFMMQVTVTN